MTPPPPLETRDAGRAYLLDMIAELSRLARGAGEAEVEILLKAILDVARVRAASRELAGRAGVGEPS